jgi:MFS family permease
MFLQALAVAGLGALGLSADAGVRAVPVLPVLVLVGLVAGGAHGFLYPGLAALVTDEAPAARRGAVVGVFSAVFLAGNAGGAFAFGHVAHAGGYGVMWTALAALLLVGAALSLRLPDGASRPRPAAERGLY